MLRLLDRSFARGSTRPVTLSCLLVLMLAGCRPAGVDPVGAGPAVPLPAGALEAQRAIVADDLLRDVTHLASDEMEGRLPGSDGDRRARAYLAEQLAAIGCEGAFDGGWEQPVTLVGVTADLPQTWAFAAGDGRSAAFRFGDEYMGASGVQVPAAGFEGAEVVFVGYGITAAEENWDDFKGADVSGAVLLMLNDDPDWDDELFAGERKLYHGRWTAKYESAARQGAAGAVIIHTTQSAGYPWQVVRSSGLGEQFQLPAGDEPRIQLEAWLAEESARRLVALSGHDYEGLLAAARSRDFRPVRLGVTTSLRWTNAMRTVETANVGGILRGGDPARAAEVVVLTAHHDHFGIGEPDETGDVVYNGALDNGVAMVQLLSVARAFAALPEPPRRSVLFLFVAAEEQGLLGSAYFARSGAVHPGRMAANVNFELGNVWGRTRDVTVYGKGKSDLDDLLAPLAATQGRVLVEDGDVRAGWFYRSDQLSFARVGVPAIWLKSGTDFIGRPQGWGEAQYADWVDRHYHRPSDEVEAWWNLDGLVEDAQLAFLLAATVATRDDLPAWVAGDEFEAARLAALADIGPDR